MNSINYIALKNTLRIFPDWLYFKERKLPRDAVNGYHFHIQHLGIFKFARYWILIANSNRFPLLIHILQIFFNFSFFFYDVVKHPCCKVDVINLSEALLLHLEVDVQSSDSSIRSGSVTMLLYKGPLSQSAGSLVSSFNGNWVQNGLWVQESISDILD